MNYAVIKSLFGEYWVGKTNLPIKKGSIFSSFDEATEAALNLNASIENQFDLVDTEEENAEIIQEEMERWII